MAFCPSSFLAISRKPKPLDSHVIVSYTILVDKTSPNYPKSFSNCISFITFSMFLMNNFMFSAFEDVNLYDNNIDVKNT
jgi:hypothetical protein